MATISPLPKELEDTMQKEQIWSASCPVPLERLRLLTLSYVDFNDTIHHDGQLVVLDAVSDQVVTIFRTLFAQGFPIHSMKTIDHYQGNDEGSMHDNNSSAFNFRLIEGQGDLVSVHSYGTAIDINPVQNPFIVLTDEDTSHVSIYPSLGQYYLNRRNMRKGMVEPIIEVFYQNGFPVWGGNWNDPVDWHHFQTTRLVAELLASMTPSHATDFFALAARHPKLFAIPADLTTVNMPLLESYKQHPEQFLDRLEQFLATHYEAIQAENASDYYQKLVSFLQSEH